MRQHKLHVAHMKRAFRPPKVDVKGLRALSPANKKAIEFFKNCPWKDWWEEFLTSRIKSGQVTYVTSWAFARVKGKTPSEVDYIYKAIGPIPTRVDPKAQNMTQTVVSPIPHLGDWQLLRAKAYFYDDESVNELKKITTEKLDGLEAGRGAALVILDLIAKWKRYDDRIDEVFPLGPVVEGNSRTGQEKYADLFFKLKNSSARGITDLIDKYLNCHGISHNGMSDFGQLVMAVGNSAARSALAGAATGAALSGQSESPALQALSRAIFDRANIFRMPLPAAVRVDGEDGEGEEDKNT